MQKNVINQIQACASMQELEELRISVLGKNGSLSRKFAELKNLDEDSKKKTAANLNKEKDEFNKYYNEKAQLLQEKELELKMQENVFNFAYFDDRAKTAAFHPLMQTKHHSVFSVIRKTSILHAQIDNIGHMTEIFYGFIQSISLQHSSVVRFFVYSKNIYLLHFT